MPVKKACNLCKQLKAKCDGDGDGTNSCSRCDKRNFSCIYNTQQKKKELTKKPKFKDRHEASELPQKEHKLGTASPLIGSQSNAMAPQVFIKSGLETGTNPDAAKNSSQFESSMPFHATSGVFSVFKEQNLFNIPEINITSFCPRPGQRYTGDFVLDSLVEKQELQHVWQLQRLQTQLKCAEEEAAKAKQEAESYKAQLADQHRSLQTQLNCAEEGARMAKEEAESYRARLADMHERENLIGRIWCVNQYCTRRFLKEQERENHMRVCTLR